MNETTQVELQDIRWTAKTSKCLLMCITTAEFGAGSSMGSKYVQYSVQDDKHRCSQGCHPAGKTQTFSP